MPMPFLPQTNAIDAFFYLLKLANPDLPSQINRNNVTIGNPTNIDVDENGNNAEVVLTVKEGVEHMSGTRTLRYKRLQMTVLLPTNGSTYVSIRKIYGSPANLDLSTNVSPYAVLYREKIAKKLGIFWDNPADFSISALVSAPGTTQNGLTLTANNNHLCYRGNITVNLVADQTIGISTALPNRQLNNQLYLADNADVFYKLLAIKPTPELLSAFRTSFGNNDTITSPVTLNTSNHQIFFTTVNNVTGLNLIATTSYMSNNGLSGATMVKVSSKDALVVLKNSGGNEDAVISAAFRDLLAQKCLRVVKITAPSNTYWRKVHLYIPLVPISYLEG